MTMDMWYFYFCKIFNSLVTTRWCPEELCRTAGYWIKSMLFIFSGMKSIYLFPLSHSTVWESFKSFVKHSLSLCMMFLEVAKEKAEWDDTNYNE